MSTRVLAALLLAAALPEARTAHAVACFATDADDVYDKDGLVSCVVDDAPRDRRIVDSSFNPGRSSRADRDGGFVTLNDAGADVRDLPPAAPHQPVQYVSPPFTWKTILAPRRFRHDRRAAAAGAELRGWSP
jgi:hypothetical protein